MRKTPAICLIGDIVVDVTLKNKSEDTKLRLGGIVHAARGLWAMNIPYDVAYFAPTYLDKEIKKYLTHHGCNEVIKLGNVTGAPNVFLIQEAKEAGTQGYEFLLRDELIVEYDNLAISHISKNKYTDHVMISGNYDLPCIANHLEKNLHLDLANNINDFSVFPQLKRKLNKLFLSTSSDIFKKHFKGNFSGFVSKFKKYAEEVILKENRGGSRAYYFKTKQLIHTPAQIRDIAHSVGVGDVYDTIYISSQNFHKNRQRGLMLSSWIAAEYAVTSYPDDFKKSVTRVLKSNIDELKKMPGILLSWEKRQQINIYIAAPDFTYMDVSTIDKLEEALKYHNFIPHRPIKENGQMEEGASKIRRQELFTKDMELFGNCQILVAVLLNNDPGTLIEIGYSIAKGLPTIVYDPYDIATNCMLTELPDLVTNDLEKVITEVFIRSNNLIHGK